MALHRSSDEVEEKSVTVWRKWGLAVFLPSLSLPPYISASRKPPQEWRRVAEGIKQWFGGGVGRISWGGGCGGGK